MGQSLAKIYLHVVFSTKNRAPLLQNGVLRDRTHAYLAGTCRNLRSPSLIVGGVADHVHLLLRLAKDVTVSNLVRELKRESSKWIKGLAPDLSAFY
jgi:REP element-mobilizing transposase RayT